MKQTTKKHDLLIDRLNDIFTALYQGSEISKNWLCGQFHITERTAYRDLARLANILDEVSPGKYRLSKERRSRLNAADIMNFASFVDVAHLFPGSSKNSLSDFIANDKNIRFHGYTSRDNSKLASVLKLLIECINDQVKISYQYKNKSRCVEPYKLINQSGLWYLAAVEGNKLKSFEVGLIQSIFVSQDFFYRDSDVLDELTINQGIRFGKKTHVTLRVSPAAAEYISRRKVFPDQMLIERKNDGTLIISTSISEPECIFRWLRYWLPEISIITPETLADDYEIDLISRVKAGIAYV
ncbi:MAG: helix-turn-helix transcriptional regulator [Aeromonas sp.]